MKTSFEKRQALYIRQGGLCRWCGRPMMAVERVLQDNPRACTLDHLFQRYFPQRKTENRIVAACYQCNQIRGRLDKIHAIANGWMKSAHPLGNAMGSLDSKFEFRFEPARQGRMPEDKKR